jgi:hypothetical protein
VAATRIEGERLRPVAAGVALAAVALLAGLSAHWYSAPEKGRPLPVERREAARLKHVLNPGERLYVLGDPTPLVLTGLRNPTRYIYLGSGVDRWAVKHEFGSLEGWEAEIRAVNPPVVVMNLWRTGLGMRMKAWLRSTYGPGKYLGSWLVFARPDVRARARARGIKLCSSC